MRDWCWTSVYEDVCIRGCSSWCGESALRGCVGIEGVC